VKDIQAIKGKYYLRQLIAEGEHERQDFKFAISDARKIARSISAFANNSGGRLLIGVKDNGTVAGVRNEEDIYVVEQAASMYCRPEQHPRFSAFRYDDGAVVIRVEVDAATQRPVRVSEPDGSWRAYYRVADENIVATPLMVRAWRRKASRQPTLISYSSSEQRLIDALSEENAALDISDIMRHCMLSRESAEEIVVRLYALGIVDFAFINRHFLITASTPADLT